DTDRLVIWLTDRNELCEQALNEFIAAWKYLGNTTITSYGYFGDSDISLGGVNSGFLVCGVQSLWALRNSRRELLYRLLAKEAYLVVFDEAHKAAADTYSQMIEFILSTSGDSKLLGLTATPGRKLSWLKVEDDENTQLANIFGGNKVTMSIPGYVSPIQYLFDNNYLATPEFKSLDYSDENILTSFDGKLLQKDAINALSENEKRNTAILNCIIEEVQQGNYIIVFASNVKHARNIEGLCLLYDIKAMSVDSSTKDRDTIIRLYRQKEIQVLINYDVLTAGFDAPHTNVAIIARPTNSLVAFSQMAGRAMRGGASGNKKCKIYTVKDDIPEFKSVAKAFEHWDEYWASEG
ncbi:MAG: DEAD/DEAH box helicase, partial [Pseudomonadota bacterium]|nr:DEAD/DEAH box helicase [Pseudomonadota bacterium]